MVDERVAALDKQILAIRNTPAVHNLIMDMWMIREDEGTDAAVAFGEMLLACVRRYQEYEDYTHRNLFGKYDA